MCSLHPCTTLTPIPHTQMLSRHSHPYSSPRGFVEPYPAPSQQASGNPSLSCMLLVIIHSASLVGSHWRTGRCLQWAYSSHICFWCCWDMCCTAGDAWSSLVAGAADTLQGSLSLSGCNQQFNFFSPAKSNFSPSRTCILQISVHCWI